MNNNYNPDKQVLLSPAHPLTRLILKSYHDVSHRGIAHVVARSRINYWIPQAAKIVKDLDCHHCHAPWRVKKKTGILKLNLYYHKYDIQKNSLCPNKSMLETDKFRFLVTFKPLNNSIIITIVSCSGSFLSFRGFFNST